MLKKNQIIQVTIEDMNHLGYGVCHIDGMAVFVRGGVSADVAEIKIIKVLKSYGVAILHRIVQPSAYRLPDPCPVHSACGAAPLRISTMNTKKSSRAALSRQNCSRRE